MRNFITSKQHSTKKPNDANTKIFSKVSFERIRLSKRCPRDTEESYLSCSPIVVSRTSPCFTVMSTHLVFDKNMTVKSDICMCPMLNIFLLIFCLAWVVLSEEDAQMY